jgi:hypothetical protein
VETFATVALVVQLAGVPGATEPPIPPPVAWQDNGAQPAAPLAQGTSGRHTQFDPSLVAWSSEPAMAYGGLTLASVQRISSQLLGSTDAARRLSGLAAAWEFPFAQLLSIVNHEVNGHGGRGREFGLEPHYGFDLLRMSAYTGTTRVPKSRDEIIAICGAGTEADSVLAHELLVDLVRPDGAEASMLPLALLAKLDLTLYVAITVRPDAANGTDFREQYQDGNDIANYLVGRQGQRRGLDLNDLWNQVADVDFGDPLLRKNANAARVAALWNVLDPVLIAAVVEYAREHLGKGAVRIRAPMLDFGGTVGLSAGTRAFLAPSYVTRYLDVYARVPFGVGFVYLRDLDSSVARTWGWGGAFTLAPPGWRLSAGVTVDRWDEPASAEHGDGLPGWNVAGEVRIPTGSRLGLVVNVGRKTAGFVPGRPVNEGTYAGIGVMVSVR